MVDRVDHVYVELAESRTVFDALTGPVGLPVVWPHREHAGRFASGGVFLGNLILELVTFAHRPDSEGAGIALAPSGRLESTRVELAARGVEVGPDQPFPASGDGGRRLWTNAALPTLSGPRLAVFLCEYATDPLQWWDPCRAEFAAVGGGQLRVLETIEIVVEANDPERVATTWAAVVGGDTQSLSPPHGPPVRVVPGARNRLDLIPVRVADPMAAQAVFERLVPHHTRLPLRFVS